MADIDDILDRAEAEAAAIRGAEMANEAAADRTSPIMPRPGPSTVGAQHLPAGLVPAGRHFMREAAAGLGLAAVTEQRGWKRFVLPALSGALVVGATAVMTLYVSRKLAKDENPWRRDMPALAAVGVGIALGILVGLIVKKLQEAPALLAQNP